MWHRGLSTFPCTRRLVTSHPNITSNLDCDLIGWSCIDTNNYRISASRHVAKTVSNWITKHKCTVETIPMAPRTNRGNLDARNKENFGLCILKMLHVLLQVKSFKVVPEIFSFLHVSTIYTCVKKKKYSWSLRILKDHTRKSVHSTHISRIYGQLLIFLFWLSGSSIQLQHYIYVHGARDHIMCTIY